jgi:hypothetical protein
VFTAVVLVIPVAVIGLFEGAYNHALKNALYFAGASSTLMNLLFPPPTYELPNNALFEVSGVMQVGTGEHHRLAVVSPRTLALRPHGCRSKERFV